MKIESEIINEVLQMPDLSLKAKAVFILIYLKPNIFLDPKTNKEKFILSCSSEGVNSIRSAITELTSYPILSKESKRENGKFSGYIWKIVNI